MGLNHTLKADISCTKAPKNMQKREWKFTKEAFKSIQFHPTWGLCSDGEVSLYEFERRVQSEVAHDVEERVKQTDHEYDQTKPQLLQLRARHLARYCIDDRYSRF